MEEDEEAAWEGWDVESDSEGSDSEEWMDVDQGGEDNLNISDSEDEAEKPSGSKPTGADADATPAAAPDPDRISTLATTKVSWHFEHLTLNLYLTLRRS